MPCFTSKLMHIWEILPLTDVFTNAIGSFLGGIFLLWLTIGASGIKSIRTRVGRPSIEIQTRRAPSNIFSAIQLGSSSDWIKQQLGYATVVREAWWGYRFSDALVSLQFDSQMAVESIAVALVDEETTFEFPTIHFECPPLGKAMVSDVLVDHLDMEFNESLRHSELLIYGREGPSGAWHYITFGALSPHAPGSLLTSEFEWNKAEELLVTAKDKVKINWAAISNRSGPAYFPWDLGLSLQS